MPRLQSRLSLLLTLVICILTICGKYTQAQGADTAHLAITVIDQSGAMIPGAEIVIDAKPCFPQPGSITDAKGEALLHSPAGSHSLSVTAQGFVPFAQKIDVKPGNNEPLRITLQVGSQTETVKVSVEIELILFHATILTGECLTEGNPQIVSAIAIAQGSIQAIGTDAEIKKLASPKTKFRDLNNAFVMPGLNDAHVHLGSAGQTKLNVDLTGTISLQDMLDRIQAKAQQSPSGHWLTGGGWDHTLWTNKTLPTRQDLDKVTGGENGNHPALLERIDGHIAVANTAALAAAKITSQSKAPQGGSVDLDRHGEPTGILRDTEMEEVEKIIPPPSPEERRQGLELAIAEAISHGLTSVQDNSEWNDFLIYEQLEQENKLPIRISEWLPFAAPLDELKSHRAHHDGNDPMLHTGMLKGFMDGSLGSRTAALKVPYSDDPKNSGLARYDQARLNAMVLERSEAGFQIGFHAIGDQAAAIALNAFAQIPATVRQDRRNRIEHAQVVDPADILRFKNLGVVASMQPNHLLTDMNWAEARLGPKRAAYSYAWKAFLDAGVPLAFGTDYPVEPVTPFRGIYSAVTRQNEAGTQIYFPENKLTCAQALYAYTQGSAYAEFAEKTKGKLIPGYDADLILLDRNLLTIPAPQILKTKVLETIVAGKTVYAYQHRVAP